MFGPTWARRVWAAVIAGVLTFFIGSLLPMWTVWYVNSWEGVGYAHTLWGMVAAWRPQQTGDEAWVELEWQTGAIVTAVAVHVALIAGAVMGGIRRSRKTDEQK